VEGIGHGSAVFCHTLHELFIVIFIRTLSLESVVLCVLPASVSTDTSHKQWLETGLTGCRGDLAR